MHFEFFHHKIQCVKSGCFIASQPDPQTGAIIETYVPNSQLHLYSVLFAVIFVAVLAITLFVMRRSALKKASTPSQ